MLNQEEKIKIVRADNHENAEFLLQDKKNTHAIIENDQKKFNKISEFLGFIFSFPNKQIPNNVDPTIFDIDIYSLSKGWVFDDLVKQSFYNLVPIKIELIKTLSDRGLLPQTIVNRITLSFLEQCDSLRAYKRNSAQEFKSFNNLKPVTVQDIYESEAYKCVLFFTEKKLLLKKLNSHLLMQSISLDLDDLAKILLSKGHIYKGKNSFLKNKQQILISEMNESEQATTTSTNITIDDKAEEPDIKDDIADDGKTKKPTTPPNSPLERSITIDQEVVVINTEESDIINHHIVDDKANKPTTPPNSPLELSTSGHEITVVTAEEPDTSEEYLLINNAKSLSEFQEMSSSQSQQLLSPFKLSDDHFVRS